MSNFEKIGGTYVSSGDYKLPNLALPKNHCIGKYGRLHLAYIKQHRNIFYTALLITGKLNQYLHEVDINATERLDLTIKQMAERQGVDEKLKAQDQMRWVGLMNDIRHCAEEVILNEAIYN